MTALVDLEMNPVGLPRPLDMTPDGTLAPVPWSQGCMGFGYVQTERLAASLRDGLCLVCGEPVDQGLVLPSPSHDLKSQYGPQHLHMVVDNGPMRRRCLKLAAHHCPHLRAGSLVLRPYTHDITGLYFSEEHGFWVEAGDPESVGPSAKAAASTLFAARS